MWVARKKLIGDMPEITGLSKEEIDEYLDDFVYMDIVLTKKIRGIVMYKPNPSVIIYEDNEEMVH